MSNSNGRIFWIHATPPGNTIDDENAQAILRKPELRYSRYLLFETKNKLFYV